MSTKLIIDKKEFHENIEEDIGTIINHLHSDAHTIFDKEEDGVLYYTITKKLPIDDLMKSIKECHLQVREKRLEKLEIVHCGVIRYKGEYYILDGDKKVPIFE